MAANVNTVDVQCIIITENDCLGAPVGTSAGGRVWVLNGNDDTNIESGPTFETIAEIVRNCYTRPADRRVSGSETTLDFGCPISNPELCAALEDGYTITYDEDNNPILSVAKPGETDCQKCGKTEEDGCDKSVSIIALVCETDCESNNVGISFMVIRSVTGGTSNSPKGVGQNGLNSPTLTLTTTTNDGYGEGPGGFIRNYDADGEPVCEPVSYRIPCPDDLDLGELHTLCGCKEDLIGCTITEEIVLANPILDIPLITGVA